MAIREVIDRGWYYVVEPDDGAHAPAGHRIVADDGRVLTRRLHGHAGRVEVVGPFSVATKLRAAGAVGRANEAGTPPMRVVLGPAGTAAARAVVEGVEVLTLDGAAIAGAPAPHAIEAEVANLLAQTPRVQPPPAGPLGPPARRALFFESLMNSDMPHNDTEISQGVLHMISPLRAIGTEVVLANVKMSITGQARPVAGLESLTAALAGGPIGLVCITLLEGYFEGVVSLIAELRRQGCRAHVAVGGVMPTLTPEHVAAHLPDVTFVCRGAGEVFVPALARILGQGDVDTPLTPEQRRALLEMDGLLVVDRAGDTLLSACTARTVAVDALDSVPLDLSFVTARHVSRGVELSTSRGCTHKCTFCSIIGRESYQARSAEGVFALLRRYEARFAELFGANVPRQAYRVHLSDDDFACDRERAISFFRALRDTPFRLSSVQVSIADLCRRQDGRLLAEPDHALLDAMAPACFADHGVAVPTRDFVADHRTRRWSAYLQIGVESFADAELVRLGKGYTRAHLRVIADELARRQIHFDAYFILSNADTSADDLLDVLDEVCRLKLRHPVYFHVRFPVVPHLVSYFPSASWRRRMRQGTHDVSVIRTWARVPGHPELDYPFVDHDRPRDPWVRAAVAENFFTDEANYTGSYDRLSAIWRARLTTLTGDARREGERLVRRLDDRTRPVVFHALAEARRESCHGEKRVEADAIRTTERILGPSSRWLRAFQQFNSGGAPRLVVIPTWQCELRCNYCYIPKQDGRVMSVDTLHHAIELLTSSSRRELQLQFFGGEALLEWGLVQEAIRYGEERATVLGKSLRFILSTNGWSLDEGRLAWLRTHPVKLELSLDGDPETQLRFRAARTVGADSYQNGIASRVGSILASGLPHDVIMVVHPLHAHRVAENFFHIAGLGFRRVQINFALGRAWNRAQMSAFAKGLHTIGNELRRRRAEGDPLVLVNTENAPMPVRLNGEVTVDWDGTVYGGNGFLHETEHKSRFVVGHLADLHGFDRYWLDQPTNDYLLEWSYPTDMTQNNLQVGAILQSFLKWMADTGA